MFGSFIEYCKVKTKTAIAQQTRHIKLKAYEYSTSLMRGWVCKPRQTSTQPQSAIVTKNNLCDINTKGRAFQDKHLYLYDIIFLYFN